MALLFVLMVLVLSVASVSSLARLSVSARLAHDLNTDTHLCDDLQRAAHLAILQWLTRDAGHVVLPPDAGEPRVTVLDDAWSSLDASRTQRIRITAWDQLGMVPLTHVRESSPLAAELPDPVHEPAKQLAGGDAPGLDGLEPASLPAGLNRFPHPQHPQHEAPAIGSLVATHNPAADHTRRARQDIGAINVNTAPIALVEAAMRLAGRDGIDQVIEARSAGRPANVPGGSRSRDPIAPRLTGQSNAWAFRVDLQSGPVKQSWWCVYLYDGSRWNLAQRFIVSDGA